MYCFVPSNEPNPSGQAFFPRRSIQAKACGEPSAPPHAPEFTTWSVRGPPRTSCSLWLALHNLGDGGSVVHSSGHSTVAEVKIHHPPGAPGLRHPQRPGEGNTKRIQEENTMLRVFRPRSTLLRQGSAEGEPWPKFPQPFLEEDGEGEEKC